MTELPYMPHIPIARTSPYTFERQITLLEKIEAVGAMANAILADINGTRDIYEGAVTKANEVLDSRLANLGAITDGVNATYTDMQALYHQNLAQAALYSSVADGTLITDRNSPYRRAFDKVYKRGFSVVEYGADPTGATDSTAAIQACADAAFASSPDAVVYFPEGTYRQEGTTTFRCGVDGTSATIKYYGWGQAVVLGDVLGSVTARRTFLLPRIIHQRALDSGSFVGGSIGVRAINLNTCYVRYDFIQAFESGFVAEGLAQGFVHTTINNGALWGNRRNLILRPSYIGEVRGWVNSNLFFGGRFSLNNGWGSVDDPGANMILLENPGNPGEGPNANTFLGTSIEGANCDKYRVVINGANNHFYNLRWEHPSTSTIRIKYGDGSNGNRIFGGYQLIRVVEEFGPGAVKNPIYVDNAHIEARASQVTPSTIATGTTGRVTWSNFNGWRATIDSATKQVITPRPGRWRIFAQVLVSCTAAPAGSSVGVTIIKEDGTVLGTSLRPISTTGQFTYPVEAHAEFAPGEAFHVEVRQTSGADATISNSAYFDKLTMEFLPN